MPRSPLILFQVMNLRSSISVQQRRLPKYRILTTALVFLRSPNPQAQHLAFSINRPRNPLFFFQHNKRLSLVSHRQHLYQLIQDPPIVFSTKHPPHLLHRRSRLGRRPFFNLSHKIKNQKSLTLSYLHNKMTK